jgi:hypothetical protein
VGGPVLHYWDVPMNDWVSGMLVDDHGVLLFSDRQLAIDTEIKFLNEWFLERGIK